MKKMNNSAERVATAIEKSNVSVDHQKSPKRIAAEQFLLSFVPAFLKCETEHEEMVLRLKVTQAFIK
jgi:hypothetical protein